MAHKIMIPRWPTWGGILLMLMVAANVAFWYKDRLFPWQPYSDVRVVHVSRDGFQIRFTANFVKEACHFERMAVVGIVAGATQTVPWSDLDGLTEEHDRELGTQTMNIEIRMRGVEYDTIEIRTRHLCGSDDKVVDRVFAVIDVLSIGGVKDEG